MSRAHIQQLENEIKIKDEDHKTQIQQLQDQIQRMPQVMVPRTSLPRRSSAASRQQQTPNGNHANFKGNLRDDSVTAVSVNFATQLSSRSLESDSFERAATEPEPLSTPQQPPVEFPVSKQRQKVLDERERRRNQVSRTLNADRAFMT